MLAVGVSTQRRSSCRLSLRARSSSSPPHGEDRPGERASAPVESAGTTTRELRPGSLRRAAAVGHRPSCRRARSSARAEPETAGLGVDGRRPSTPIDRSGSYVIPGQGPNPLFRRSVVVTTVRSDSRSRRPAARIADGHGRRAVAVSGASVSRATTPRDPHARTRRVEREAERSRSERDHRRIGRGHDDAEDAEVARPVDVFIHWWLARWRHHPRRRARAGSRSGRRRAETGASPLRPAAEDLRGTIVSPAAAIGPYVDQYPSSSGYRSGLRTRRCCDTAPAVRFRRPIITASVRGSPGSSRYLYNGRGPWIRCRRRSSKREESTRTECLDRRSASTKTRS